jgi:hypothetical protein
MDDEVYKLRRAVMVHIYEARDLVPGLPRVDVRITDNNGGILGVARMSGLHIWVPEKAITDPSIDLRGVVFHELLHAIYGIEHHDGDPLMSPTANKLSREEAERCFVRWAKAGARGEV